MNYGLLDGLSYCGPRVIELTTDPLLYQSFLSLDPVAKTITVQTNDSADRGTHIIDAKISLVNYPGVFTTAQF